MSNLKPTAITTVSIGAWKEDGSPTAFMESAVCDECGEWATNLATATRARAREEVFGDRRTSRKENAVVYACDIHRDSVSGRLASEYGYSMNDIYPDALSAKVARSDRP